MKFLKFLFGGKPVQADPRAEMRQVAAGAVKSVMAMNFGMLGWEPMTRSLDGPEGDKRSCGYLVGLSEGVLKEFASMSPDVEDFMATASVAFAYVFGETADNATWHRLLDTVDQFKERDVEVHLGYADGAEDARILYAGEAFSSPLGYWRMHDLDQN